MSSATESSMNKAKSRLAGAFARLEKLAAENAKARKELAALTKIREELARELEEKNEAYSRLSSVLHNVSERLENALLRVDALMEEEHGEAHG